MRTLFYALEMDYLKSQLTIDPQDKSNVLLLILSK
jgi:hypothetical protein